MLPSCASAQRRVAVLAFGLVCLLYRAAAHGQTSERRSRPAAGASLAFASLGPLNTDLFVADAGGGDATRLLPHPALDYDASFSPDGRWIVFTSERAGSADIYRVRVDGSGLERLTDDPAFDDQGALSPDGRSLAFVSSRSGQADVWVLDLATRALHNLTRHSGGDFRPAWSPDGRWIAFSSDRDSEQPQRHVGFTTLHSTEIYVMQRDGSGPRRLTRRGAFAGSPSWAPDGAQLVVYEADEAGVRNITSPRRVRGTTQIATIDVGTGEWRVLTTGTGEKWSPRWLPDGRIGYVSGGPEGGLEFVRTAAGTSEPAAAGARGEIQSPSWSPDGQRVVFHREVGSGWPPHHAWPSRDARYLLVRTGLFPSYAPAGDQLVLNDATAGIVHNRILLRDADGSRSAVLFADSSRSALAPAWSPLGDRVAFALGTFFPGNPNLVAPPYAVLAFVQRDGSGLTLLTDSLGNAGFPSWAPDGRQIVYRDWKDRRSALKIVDIESRKVQAVTDGSGNDNSPAWSPRGDRIAFTTKHPGEVDYDIFTIRPDGTGLRRLTRSVGNDSHPAWSPDGEWIAFASARGGFKDEAVLHPYNPQPYGDLYVMRADGSDLRQLTDNQFEDGTPTWIPTAPLQPSRVRTRRAATTR